MGFGCGWLTGSLCANAGWGVVTGACAADEATSRGYAEEAFEAQRQNVVNACGYAGDRWSWNLGDHRYVDTSLPGRGSQRACYSLPVKVSEVVRLLRDDGWYLVATRGSHHQYKHPTKLGRVTVPGKPSDDLAPGTLNSILKQAGLKE